MFCKKNIFISHSSENKEIAEQLCAFITRLGVCENRIFCSSSTHLTNTSPPKTLPVLKHTLGWIYDINCPFSKADSLIKLICSNNRTFFFTSSVK